MPGYTSRPSWQLPPFRNRPALAVWASDDRLCTFVAGNPRMPPLAQDIYRLRLLDQEDEQSAQEQQQTDTQVWNMMQVPRERSGVVRGWGRGVRWNFEVLASFGFCAGYDCLLFVSPLLNPLLFPFPQIPARITTQEAVSYPAPTKAFSQQLVNMCGLVPRLFTPHLEQTRQLMGCWDCTGA